MLYRMNYRLIVGNNNKILDAAKFVCLYSGQERKKAKSEYGSDKQDNWDLDGIYAHGAIHKYDIHSNVNFKSLWIQAHISLKETTINHIICCIWSSKQHSSQPGV